MYISKIHINGYRNFKDKTIDFYNKIREALYEFVARDDNSPNRLHSIIEKLVNKSRFHTQNDTARI